MTDAISAAVEAAKAATANVPMTAPPTAGTAVASMPARGTPVSLQDMVTGSTAVDLYAKVSKTGIQLGENPKFLCDEFIAELNLADVVAFYGVRFGAGSSTTYKRSLDRVTEQQTGRAWATIVAEAQQIDPKCKGDYQGADIPLKLVDQVDGGKNADPIEAGKIVGYTTSITGFKPFQSFAQQMYKAGLGDVPLKVKVSHKYENRNGNEWGILLFELLGMAEPVSNEVAETAEA